MKNNAEVTSLPEYCERLAADQKYIYYLSAPRYDSFIDNLFF